MCNTQWQEIFLWAEAANTATLLKNSLNVPTRDLSQFQQLFGKGRRIITNPTLNFGEI